MTLGILTTGLFTAVSGTLFAVTMGLDLSLAIFAYGLFGIGGGMFACLGNAPKLHNFGNHSSSNNRTLG